MKPRFTSLKLRFNAASGGNVERYLIVDEALKQKTARWMWENKKATTEDLSEFLKENGALLHRRHGPAETSTSPDGSISQQWRLYGKLHRKNAPAVISILPNGDQAGVYFTKGEMGNKKGGDTPDAVSQIGNKITKIFINR